MRRQRKIQIMVIIATIMGVAGYCTLWRQQLWPFAPFTMYAFIIKPYKATVFSHYYVHFVNQDGTEELARVRKHFQWSAYRISWAIRSLNLKGQSDDVPRFLKLILSEYHATRSSILREDGSSQSQSEWPDFRALRLYEAKPETQNGLMIPGPTDSMILEIAKINEGPDVGQNR